MLKLSYKQPAVIVLTLILLGTVCSPIDVLAKNPARQTAPVSKPSSTFDLQKAKDQLNKMLGQLEDYFRKVRTKAQNLKKLDTNQKEDILQNIDAYIANINTFRNEISRDPDQESLKSTAAKIHTLIADAKHEIKQLLSKRLEEHINSFEKNSQKGVNIIDVTRTNLMELMANGDDVSNLIQSLSTCQSLVDKGDGMLKQAKEKFEQIQGLSADDRQGPVLVKDGLTLLKNARSSFNEARTNCGDVMNGLQTQKHSF
jgi:hypothetical protein